MNWLLLVAELALLIKMLLTSEFLRRPGFFNFITFCAVGALTYSHDRQAWLNMATIYSLMLAWVLLEATYWATQRSHFLQTIAFGVTLAMFSTRRALEEVPDDTFGPDVKMQTVIMAYYAVFWLFVVGNTLVNPAVRLQGGRVRAFDWTLLLWILTKAGFRIFGYYIPGGAKNPDWPMWNSIATMLLIVSMLSWLLADRIADYLYHDAIADERREHERLCDGKLQAKHRLA